jgi:hypothetical protein
MPLSALMLAKMDCASRILLVIKHEITFATLAQRHVEHVAFVTNSTMILNAVSVKIMRI